MLPPELGSALPGQPGPTGEAVHGDEHNHTHEAHHGKSLLFYLNDARHELASGELDPTQTLLSYIRDVAGLKGTKLGCGEGGYVCVALTLCLCECVCVYVW